MVRAILLDIDGTSSADTALYRPGPPARDPVPAPPWRVEARARAGPRLPLTRDAIVAAALRVLDRAGLDGLSMRRVAAELRTGVASLYWHVRNKGELLQLLNERLAAEIALPAPDPSRRAIGDLVGGVPDERFEFGLDILVRGLGTYARPGAARDGEAGQGR